MTNLPEGLEDVLRCPHCGRVLAPVADGLRCGGGHLLEERDGWIDAFVGAPDEATAQTLSSFGYEWTTFSAVNAEDEAFWRMYVRDLDLDRLQGRVGLDAGCGKARYSRFFAPHLRALVALDGSAAVQAAARNLADCGNALVVRADLRRPPLADASLGFVSSLGVLHHLDEPRAGFDRLVRLLAPGGLLLLYLYSRPDRPGVRAAGLAAAALLRRATVRLPHPLLRVLCWPLAAVLYGAFVLPGRLGERWGVAALAGLPLQVYRGRPVRSLWLDTFDRLSAPLEARYVWADLAPWFAEAGLEVEAVREEAGLFILARRPDGPARA